MLVLAAPKPKIYRKSSEKVWKERVVGEGLRFPGQSEVRTLPSRCLRLLGNGGSLSVKHWRPLERCLLGLQPEVLGYLVLPTSTPV